MTSIRVCFESDGTIVLGSSAQLLVPSASSRAELLATVSALSGSDCTAYALSIRDPATALLVDIKDGQPLHSQVSALGISHEAAPVSIVCRTRDPLPSEPADAPLTDWARCVAAAGSFAVCGTYDHAVTVFDVSSGAPCELWRAVLDAVPTAVSLETGPVVVAGTASGALYVIGGSPGALRMVRLAPMPSGVQSITTSECLLVVGDTGGCVRVYTLFSNLSSLLESPHAIDVSPVLPDVVHASVARRGSKTARKEHTLPLKVHTLRTATWLAHDGAVTGVAVMPDGNVLSTSSDGGVRVFGVSGMSPDAPVLGEAPEADRAYDPFGDDPAESRVARASPLAERMCRHGISCAAYARGLLVCGHHNGALSLLSVGRTVSILHALPAAHEGAVTSVALEPVQRGRDDATGIVRLASTGQDGALRVWEVSVSGSGAAMQMVGEPLVAPGAERRILGASWIPAGVISGGQADLSLWPICQ